MKKKFIIVLVTLFLLLGIGGGIYYYLNRQDENSLTIIEKQWIEDNKNNMIDFSIANNIPIFSNDGEGLVYDFLNQLEKDTGLEFNKIADDDEQTSYSFSIVEEPTKNDIVLYNDNYALVTKTNEKYNSLNDINNISVGVLKKDIDRVTKYLNNNTISYKTYDNIDEMIADLNLKDSKLDGIVVPKTINLKAIIQNNLTISYNITEMKTNLVISLGNTSKLNDIITKYYKKWANNNFEQSYNESFLNTYYAYTTFDDDTKVNFKSKRYKYGFVSNAPYDKLIDNKLVGINSEIIKEFSKITGIEVTFTEYKSNADMIKDFNQNKLDFFFNTTATKKYDMDVVNTVSLSDEQVVILSNINNDNIVNSIYSLENNTIYTVANTQIDDYLKENNIATKSFKNIDKLLEKVKANNIMAIDSLTYNTYKNSILKNYKIDYMLPLNTDYYYVSRDIKDNTLFNSFFNFYLSYINEKQFINRVNYKTFEEANKFAFVRPLLFTIFAVIILLVITLIIKRFKNRNKKVKGVSKEDKLRYIDMLTSLKNRNYLNDSIEKWDESEIYPQAIVIADLNNIAYINDNYGHNEGDSVIKEAANILIKNQQEQSEIIRTNGNEFLIYLVGYEEKQIVSYTRKLNKEFKELEHGFGAAVGYSMINDGLKTVDDAINEATLDMRANKEETHE